MKKIVKYTLILLVIALAGYKSVYFKKLSEVKKAVNEKFDAEAFAQKCWNEKLPVKLDSAVELTDLIRAIETNSDAAFAKYSNAMAIGNYRYCLVKTIGAVAAVKDDEIILQVKHADSLLTVTLSTEYVYGNAIRDASALVDLKDFTSSADLNNISESLNKIVRITVIPGLKKQVKQGDRIAVTAAAGINKEHPRLNELELIPLRFKILIIH